MPKVNAYKAGLDRNAANYTPLSPLSLLSSSSTSALALPTLSLLSLPETVAFAVAVELVVLAARRSGDPLERGALELGDRRDLGVDDDLVVLVAELRQGAAGEGADGLHLLCLAQLPLKGCAGSLRALQLGDIVHYDGSGDSGAGCILDRRNAGKYRDVAPIFGDTLHFP